MEEEMFYDSTDWEEIMKKQDEKLKEKDVEIKACTGRKFKDDG